MNAECRMRNAEWVADRNRNGFTLIEIIITLVVLSIAAIGVLSVFATGMRGSADPLLISQATQLAQERMETIIGDRQNTARGFNWIIPGNYAADNPMLGAISFNRNVQIFCVTAANLNTNTGLAPPCASGYTHVIVTVNNATIGNVSMETIVTSY